MRPELALLQTMYLCLALNMLYVSLYCDLRVERPMNLFSCLKCAESRERGKHRPFFFLFFSHRQPSLAMIVNNDDGRDAGDSVI